MPVYTKDVDRLTDEEREEHERNQREQEALGRAQDAVEIVFLAVVAFFVLLFVAGFLFLTFA